MISTIRKILYTTAKILGDIQAIRRGTIGKRIYNRMLGKFFGRFFR